MANYNDSGFQIYDNYITPVPMTTSTTRPSRLATVVEDVPAVRGTKEQRINALKKVLEGVGALMEEMDAWPDEPSGRNPVITFTKQFAPRATKYNYAAIKAGGRWFLTGKETDSFTWAELMDWIGEYKDTIKLVTKREKI